MRIIGFDTETSGLDPLVYRVTEYGWCLWETDTGTPLVLGGGLVKPNPGEPEIAADVVALNGITNEMRNTFGRVGVDVLAELGAVLDRFSVERIVAHNAPFDRGFLAAELDRLTNFDRYYFDRLKWIDTRRDLAFQVGSAKLTHMAADRGILNPFPHRAVTDALTALLVLQTVPIADVIARADSPFVVLHSVHAFDDNAKAKGLGFGWKPELGKRWLQAVKEIDLPMLREKAAALPELKISRIKDVTPEEVMA